jgi:hypothetical protein
MGGRRRFSMKRGWLGRGRDLSVSSGWGWFSSLCGPVWRGSGLVGELVQWSNSVEGRQAARIFVGPAGAKGSPLVSMCQMASVSFGAISTRATLAPRWRPRRTLVRW